MPVRDNRVGPFDSVGQRPRTRSQTREQTKRTIDVKPSRVALAQLGHIDDRVEIARVHLARVGDHNRRRASLGQLALERREIEPADIVSCQAANVRSTQAEHPDRLHRARV